ncbi:amidase [Ideonella azotifigens]|uniref:Amidase n=1 Tax=Ideonella azotifigens TaxID=513160 RepID=A0ABP3VJW9_9BURK|nr:amidase [Ideonella azotifigens]MCD2344056.1 amidase [Ideonella azotifigens]
MADLHALSATELTPLYHTGTLSPVDVTRAVLAHIEAWEPQLCATWALDADEALRMATASEARWAAGASLGPLDGVPVTLKENIATRGVPQPLGCAATALTPAVEDAPPAARLREAGAVFVARTTMPDWGMLSSGLSSFHKLARNPWDLRKNPGGSSAGAAAAAAAGYGPLHLGTDIGGSIRLPASWCGVVGFKPSLGRIPIKPPYAGRVAGPICRTVADAALAMQTLSRPDWRDATSLPAQPIAWAEHGQRAQQADSGRAAAGLRIGLLLDAGWGDALQPAVRAAIEAAARAFEAQGAVVEPLGPVSTRAMVQGLDRFWRMRSWMDYATLPPERQAKVLPYIRDWIASGEQLSAAEVFQGHAQIAALRDAAVTATHGFDYVLSPVSPDVAFPAEQASPLNDPARPFEHIAYTLPWNMSEQPALSVPAGHDAAGLPIGLQIIGRRHDDLGVLQLGALWERLRPALRPWPAPPPARG